MTKAGVRPIAGAAADEPAAEETDDAWLDRVARESSVGLYRFALSISRDPVESEDLVQETLLRAVERRAQLRRSESLEPWLRRILHNLAVDRARRGSRELLVEEVEERWRDDAYTVDTHAVVERAQVREELEDALVRLPFPYRAAVVLHDLEGWTSREAAEVMGIGLAAAKQRLRRGRMMLVTALAKGSERREALEGVPLRCWEARRQVSDYLDDEVDGGVRAALERHLAVCPTCPPLYASLVGVRAELSGLRDPDAVIPPALIEQICRRLAARERPDPAAEPGDPSNPA